MTIIEITLTHEQTGFHSYYKVVTQSLKSKPSENIESSLINIINYILEVFEPYR